MTGGADRVSGTQRPYNYFRLYRDRGAPWAFLVQNETPHCCIINTKALMLAWLGQIIKLRHLSSAKPLRPINVQHGWEGFVHTYPSGVQDTWGAPGWNVSEATIQQVGCAGPADMIPSGWLPNHRVATEWLNFIKQPTHATTSQP